MLRTTRCWLWVIILLFSYPLASFAADPENAVPRFDIRGYEVRGNTILPADRVEAILAPFTGKDRDFGTVQGAVEALEKEYRGGGFSMVAVVLPEQEMQDGVIRLQVIEYRIGRIAVEGNRFFDERNILRSLPALQPGKTPDIDALSRSLNLANENPAKKTDLKFKSGEGQEVDATVTVKDEKPWRAGVSLDNSGDKHTGRSRMGFLLQHGNVANLDHVLTLQYITSPENLDDVHIFGLGYHMPLYSPGSSIDIIAAHSNVDSGSVNVATYNMGISGKGTVLALRYNQNLTRIGDYEHRLILGLEYKAFENDVQYLGYQLGHNVTVHPLSLTYAGTLTRMKHTAGFYLTGVQNLSWSLDGRDGEANFASARAGSSMEYTILRYGGNFMLMPGGDWRVRAVFNGQYTQNALVSGEQFGLGGAASVRGLQERAYANDYGYSGSIEVYSPDLLRLAGVSAVQARLLAFCDHGQARRNKPVAGDTVAVEATSIGPGLRITDGRHFSVSIDYGIVMEPPEDGTTRWSGMWHLSASFLF
ncbi:MAG TPA: ShlB/FhaC/HecB family hemolysin secretion/activation protein [Syntrophales bacterium]|nr:ShlB/FhaC/HecB family hemolysin secretion/activation protein [Syntrophales bacterium]